MSYKGQSSKYYDEYTIKCGRCEHIIDRESGKCWYCEMVAKGEIRPDRRGHYYE